ncbi:MAG: hypothetical protein ABSB14_20605, partial [Candidatus Sulfotelmatobacter sp.]
KALRRMNYGISATLAMRTIAGAYRKSGRGIQSALPLEPCAAKTRPPDVFTFATYASAVIVQRSMGCWSLIQSRLSGENSIATAECSAWPNVFLSPTSKRGKDGK